MSLTVEILQSLRRPGEAGWMLKSPRRMRRTNLILRALTTVLKEVETAEMRTLKYHVGIVAVLRERGGVGEMAQLQLQPRPGLETRC